MAYILSTLDPHPLSHSEKSSWEAIDLCRLTGLKRK
jgi:hypothetical protein